MKLPIIHNQIRQKSLDLVVQEIRGGAGLHLVFLNETTEQEVENRNSPTGSEGLLRHAVEYFPITNDVRYAVNNPGVRQISGITSVKLGEITYYTLEAGGPLGGPLSNSSIVKSHNEDGIYWLNLLANPEVKFTSAITYNAIAVVMNYDNAENTGIILMAARTIDKEVEQGIGDEKNFPLVITF